MTPPGELSYAAVIDADPDRVWSIVRRFGEVAAWNPIATESRLVAGREGEIGAERELTIADGQSARERLTALDDRDRRLSYEMVTFPIPVTRQENMIAVAAVSGGGARVTFSSRFQPRGDHRPDEIAALNRSAFEQAAAKLAQLVGSHGRGGR